MWYIWLADGVEQSETTAGVQFLEFEKPDLSEGSALPPILADASTNATFLVRLRPCMIFSTPPPYIVNLVYTHV